MISGLFIIFEGQFHVNDIVFLLERLPTIYPAVSQVPPESAGVESLSASSTGS